MTYHKTWTLDPGFFTEIHPYVVADRVAILTLLMAAGRRLLTSAWLTCAVDVVLTWLNLVWLAALQDKKPPSDIHLNARQDEGG